MMGAVGKLERNTIVDNVKIGHKQRARTGKQNGKVPLGCQGRQTRERDQDHHRRGGGGTCPQHFRTVCRRSRPEGDCQRPEPRGHKTRTGKVFSTCAIRDILDNPMFVGKIRYNSYENWAKRRRNGKSTEFILSEGHHPAIISEELWEMVQLLRQKKSVMPKKRFEGEYLLTGLIRCPECGAAMTASRTVNRAKDGTKIVRMYYSCGRFRSEGSSVCHANSIRKDEVENAVTERIRQAVTQPHILKRVVRSINEHRSGRIKPLRDELAAVQARIDKLEEKKRKYLGLYEMDEIDRDLFAERLNDLNRELDIELTRRSKLELRDDQAEPVSYELVRSPVGRFDTLLHRSPFPKRKTLIHLIVKRITLDERKRVGSVELAFNEETEKHFLSKAPSADSMAEGAFPLTGKAPLLKISFSLVI